MQVPLFADATMTDTDMIQKPSDRFHRWLLNFTSVVQEFRINELMVWNEDLQELLTRPADEALKRQVTKAGTWIMLLHELQMMQSAFTRMLFSDQIIAVDRFEVGTTLRYELGERQELVPIEVEIMKAHFPAPFLASVFGITWRHIKDADIESVAILELKRVTVHKIPGSWIRKDRYGEESFAVTALLHERRDQCDICREFANVPFASCWYCSDSPCYHHGRCCPSHRRPQACLLTMDRSRENCYRLLSQDVHF